MRKASKPTVSVRPKSGPCWGTCATTRYPTRDQVMFLLSIEFIPIKSLAATGSNAPGNYAGHSRVPSPDHGPLLPQANPILHDTAALDTTVDVLDP